MRCPGGSTYRTRMHTWVNNEQALAGWRRDPRAVRDKPANGPLSHSWCSPPASARARLGRRRRRRDATDTRDLPDVAVGLALAAHIARGSKGARCLTRRHPTVPGGQPWTRAKPPWRERAVNGGIVLGDDHRIPDETVALLRQILRARDWSGILADVHDLITQVGAVIAAFVGLLLIGVGVVKGCHWPGKKVAGA